MLGAFFAGRSVGVKRVIDFLRRVLWRQCKATLTDRDIKLPLQHTEVVRLTLSPMEQALYDQLYKAGHDSLQKARQEAEAEAEAEGSSGVPQRPEHGQRRGRGRGSVQGRGQAHGQGQRQGQGRGQAQAPAPGHSIVPEWSGMSHLTELLSCCTHAGGGVAFRALAPGRMGQVRDGDPTVYSIEDTLLHIVRTQSVTLMKASQALGSLFHGVARPQAALQAMERGLEVVAGAAERPAYRAAMQVAGAAPQHRGRPGRDGDWRLVQALTAARQVRPEVMREVTAALRRLKQTVNAVGTTQVVFGAVAWDMGRGRRVARGARVIGRSAEGMGHGALGMGHEALVIGHGAWGMRDR